MPMADWSVFRSHIRRHHRLPVFVGFDFFLCKGLDQSFAVLAQVTRATESSQAIVPDPKVPIGAVTLRNGQVRFRGGVPDIHILKGVMIVRSWFEITPYGEESHNTSVMMRHEFEARLR